ncbi:MAG: NifB/NifX family molybdenum-iron cluster-binding protein [Planctomycetota bacterium]
MKIAVTSTGPTLEHSVGAKANRCGYLLIVDPDTMRYEVVPNPVVALRGPVAGKLCVQMLLEEDVHAIVVGGCDAAMLSSTADAGISVFVGAAGSVRGAVQRFSGSFC